MTGQRRTTRARDWLRIAAWAWAAFAVLAAASAVLAAIAGNWWTASANAGACVVAVASLLTIRVAMLWRAEAHELTDQLDEWTGSDA